MKIKSLILAVAMSMFSLAVNAAGDACSSCHQGVVSEDVVFDEALKVITKHRSKNMKAKNVAVVSILGAARAIASANGGGVDVSEFEGDVKFTLDSSAGGGADNTNDIKLQHSDDDATYVDVPGGVFTQVTNAGPAFESLIVNSDGLKKFVRGAETINGTGPTFDRGLSMVGQKKYS